MRLVPYAERSEPRVPGSMVGRIAIASGFDETPAWLVDAFEGTDQATSVTG